MPVTDVTSYILMSSFCYIKITINNRCDVNILDIFIFMMLREHDFIHTSLIVQSSGTYCMKIFLIQIKISVPFFDLFQLNHSSRLTDVRGEEKNMGSDNELELAVRRKTIFYPLRYHNPRSYYPSFRGP